jgi:LmbE family N-acetylglucosaminyl deacetylase
MRFALDTAELFVPDGLPEAGALARTTHMSFGAHQDDIEIMAASAILECYQQTDKWFTGVVVTNGAGSPRADLYKDYTDDDMRTVRRKEQKKAAVIGEYAAQALLDFSSGAVKDASNAGPVGDIALLLKTARPKFVYTHNLGDKHDTHVGVAVRVVQACRVLPPELRPEKLFGCEVWRDLDWMIDEDKVPFDVSAHENLQAALLGVFDSQIAGGKRYDLASMGRRKAHATYYASHGVDATTGLTFGMDLTPLIQEPSLSIADFTQRFIDRFAAEIAGRLKKLI